MFEALLSFIPISFHHMRISELVPGHGQASVLLLGLALSELYHDGIEELKVVKSGLRLVGFRGNATQVMANLGR